MAIFTWHTLGNTGASLSAKWPQCFYLFGFRITASVPWYLSEGHQSYPSSYALLLMFAMLTLQNLDRFSLMYNLIFTCLLVCIFLIPDTNVCMQCAAPSPSLESSLSFSSRFFILQKKTLFCYINFARKRINC